MLAGHNQVHDVGRIPLLVEVKQVLTDAFFLQTLQVAAVESTQSAIRMREGLQHHKFAPGIALLRHVELRINCIHLTLCLRITEQRGNEELSEHVKGLFEAIVGDFEVVVCVGQARKGVVVPALVLDVV